MSNSYLACCIVAVTLSAMVSGAVANASLPAQPLVYPDTRKTDQVDTYHGTVVADPYRWLEDDNSAET
jgi:prolyl oligopeptidase